MRVAWLAVLTMLPMGCSSAPARRPAAETTGRTAWEFRGAAQLATVRDEARARGTLVLVGLSGSDG